MDLKKCISWAPTYDSNFHDLLTEFYIPVLSNTIRYDRITGYFTSSVLTAASAAFEKFCDRDNSKMRMIVGLQLDESDYRHILYAEDPGELDEIMKEMVLSELGSEGIPEFQKSRLSALTWMLLNGKLEIKFGVMLNRNTKQPMPWEWAKFHGKMAIFSEEIRPGSNPELNTAVFTGSVNETMSAWMNNGESLVPSVSWELGRSRSVVSNCVSDFEKLWATKGLNHEMNVGIYSIIDLPKHFLRFFTPIHPHDSSTWPSHPVKGGASIQENNNTGDDAKWVHQKDAVELFLKGRDKEAKQPPMPAGYRGILCMATGTGKTRTALKIVKEMYDLELIENVIVTTLRGTVLEQWDKEIRDPTRGLTNHLGPGYREHSKYRFSRSKNKFLIVGRDGFQKLLKSLSEEKFSKTLLIVDECHNFRGEKGREILGGLYKKIPYRLGLSATPESEYNEEATQFLFDEIGPIYFNFGLKEAIEKGILCPFNYTSISYTPTASEVAESVKIRKKFEGAKKKDPANATNITIRMRQEIAKVWKKSMGKLPGIEEILSDEKNLDRCIIFGPEKEYNSEILNMLEQTLSKFNKKYTTFYGETENKQLDEYRKGHIDVLLTCKAISEGIDLDVQTIILVSSDGPRLETVQRIGRALRTHGDGQKVAKVFDFIRDNSEESADIKRRDWLSSLSLNTDKKI
jgi:superfamily II DNA or RNA helicase